MLRYVVLVFLFRFSVGEIFDFSDIDDDNLLWGKSEKIQLKQTECQVQSKSGLKYGTCIPFTSCLLSKGTSNGICGVLKTCCVYENTCGKSSDAKVSYFETSEVSTDTTTCEYTVKLRNKNICQVRLDFVKFNLAPATLTTPQYSSRKAYKCVDDILKISPNDFKIPDLCGNNDKQHVYVHVNQTDGVTKGVSLKMTLANRNYNPSLFTPSWKIKITQLECPGKRSGINFGDNQDVIEDFHLLAPLGAIQYFTEHSGYFKSFGFDGSVSQYQSYTYGQSYAIAFKREINVCGIKFSPDYINLPFDNSLGIHRDSDCYHYLSVPELYFDDSLSLSKEMVYKVCLSKAENFRSYAPGPLFIHFNSATTDFNTDETKKQGFNIKYQLLSRCP